MNKNELRAYFGLAPIKEEPFDIQAYDEWSFFMNELDIDIDSVHPEERERLHKKYVEYKKTGL